MAASDKIYAIKLDEEDVPGAKFRCSDVSEHSIVELKRWLECRGLTTSGKKPELVQRCLDCINSNNTDIVISVDDGKWYEQKVKEVLSVKRGNSISSKTVPILPTTGWQTFPAGTIPKGFCYGRIYEHIIQTARVNFADTDSDEENNLTDFNTSKPMLKGRQYFLSGHVKNLCSISKEETYFLKSTVQASYTQQKQYHVSITLQSPSGKVLDASCDCKASAMGRCNHVAALLYALEDYTLQFGYEASDACTSKLCTWNVGRKSKRQPQPCHTTSYNKKMKADRYRNYNPLNTGNQVDEAAFINDFISSLPNAGQNLMMQQILEIEYEDYDVDIDDLRLRTNAALEAMKFDDAGLPFEVPGTAGQSECIMWHSARNCRLTASVAKEASTLKTPRAVYNFMDKVLWGKKLPHLKSLQYGKENENTAFDVYKESVKDIITVMKSGFWIDPAFPELGCSPDGLLYTAKDNKLVGVVEIKCPLVLKDKDPLFLDELKKSQKNNLCYKIENGAIELKKSHSYYSQIQMQMGILKVEYCDFVIWSNVNFVKQRISFDREFWDELRSKLLEFHHRYMMAEYLEMRIPRKLLPVQL